MIRIKSRVAICVALLMILALWIPAIRESSAEGEQTIELRISEDTEVLDDAGKKIGELRPGESGTSAVYAPNGGEEIPNVAVAYTLSGSIAAEPNQALAGKAMVTLRWTQEETLVVWIDSSIVLAALETLHAADAGAIGSMQAEIESLHNRLEKANETIAANAQAVEQAAAEPGKTPWTFAWSSTVFQIAVCALGALGLLCLIWIGISLVRGVTRIEEVSDRVNGVNARMKEGLSIKNTVRVEQTGWPQNGRVMIGAESLDKLASEMRRTLESNEKKRSFEPPAPIVYPPGREPELLALANRLAGVGFAEKWYEQIRSAGYRVVLLTTNPRERGTLIADSTGNSILACLMTSADAEIGYLIPSFQDPRADEPDWSDYYLVKEDETVQNYRIEELALMHVERGTFFMRKSTGILLHRR